MEHIKSNELDLSTERDSGEVDTDNKHNITETIYEKELKVLDDLFANAAVYIIFVNLIIALLVLKMPFLPFESIRGG